MPNTAIDSPEAPVASCGSIACPIEFLTFYFPSQQKSQAKGTAYITSLEPCQSLWPSSCDWIPLSFTRKISKCTLINWLLSLSVYWTYRELCFGMTDYLCLYPVTFTIMLKKKITIIHHDSPCVISLLAWPGWPLPPLGSTQHDRPGNTPRIISQFWARAISNR